MARLSAREIDSAFAEDYTEQEAQDEHDAIMDALEETFEDCYSHLRDEEPEERDESFDWGPNEYDYSFDEYDFGHHEDDY